MPSSGFATEGEMMSEKLEHDLRVAANIQRGLLGPGSATAAILDEAAAALKAAREENERLKREHLARSKIDPVTRLHNLCDHLAEHRRESPYDEKSWELQDAAYLEKCKELAAAVAERDALRELLPDLRRFVDAKGITVGADVLIDRIDAALTPRVP